jgi:predicted O-methyltransferase YrrM
MLQHHVVFEIGTFTGLTTSLFILNSAPGARIISVDLPPDEDVSNHGYIGTDEHLVKTRKVGHYTSVLGIADRYEQWFCDSRQIDPEPLRESVDLAFIDGAHALPYVMSDTEKVGRMIRDNGVVFWHDYGGVGEFLPLTQYLESLSKAAPLWVIPGTSTAWCLGSDLKKALGQRKVRVTAPV